MVTKVRNLVLLAAPVLAGVLVLALVINARKPPAQRAPGERTTAVRVIALEPQVFVPRVIGYGTVQPARTWNAVAQVSGRLDYVHPGFKRGNLLKAGTEIFRINPRDYQLAKREAEANIQSGAAKLTEIKVQQDNSRKSLEIERSSVAIRRNELQRKQGLVKRGTISAASLEAVQRELLTQQARVLDLENALRLVPSQVLAQKQQIAVYEAKLETAKLNLKRTRIKLPFDARVAETNVEVTQYVGVSTVLGSTDGIAIAEVAAQVPVSRFRKFVSMTAPAGFQNTALGERTIKEVIEKFGWSAVVRLGSGPEAVTWSARVLRTSDTIDPNTRTVGAIVAVDAPYATARPGLRPPLVKGMFVEVAIEGPPIKGQIVIPRAAVRNGAVFLANAQNRLEIRPVTIKLTQGDHAVVATGLSAGERLILSDISPAIVGMALDPSDVSQIGTRGDGQRGGKGEAP